MKRSSTDIKWLSCSVACYQSHKEECHATHKQNGETAVATTVSQDGPRTKTAVKGLLYPSDTVQPMYTMLNQEGASNEDIITRRELEKIALDPIVRRLLYKKSTGHFDLKWLLRTIDSFKSQRIRGKIIEDILQNVDRETLSEEQDTATFRAGWVSEVIRYNEWQLLEREGGRRVDQGSVVELADLVQRILSIISTG